MPQLDTIIFFNQFFWFFSSFFFLYYFFAYVMIPQINFYYFIRFNIFKILTDLESNFAIETAIITYNFQYSIETSLFYSYFFHKIQNDTLSYFCNSIEFTDKIDLYISELNSKIISIFILESEII